MLISFSVTAKLICAFVFAYADCSFSHAAVQKYREIVCYVFQGLVRLSNLAAPIMLLTGHEGEIFSTKFSPDGKMLASAGFDRLICKYTVS